MKIVDLIQSPNTKVVSPLNVSLNDSAPAEISPTTSGTAGIEAAVKSMLPKILDDLMLTISARQTTLDSLPPDVKDLLQQRLTSNQAGLNIVEQGAAAMYKSERSAAQIVQNVAQDLELGAGVQKTLDSSSTTSQKLLLSIADKLSQSVQSSSNAISIKILTSMADSVMQNRLSPPLAQALSTYNSAMTQDKTLISLSESLQPALISGQVPSLVEMVSQKFAQPELAKLWVAVMAMEAGTSGLSEVQVASLKQVTDTLSSFFLSTASGSIVGQLAVLIGAAVNPLQKTTQFQTSVADLLKMVQDLNDSLGDDTLLNQLVDLLKNNLPKVSVGNQLTPLQEDLTKLLTLGKLADLKQGLTMEAQTKQTALSTLRELEKLFREPEKHPFLDHKAPEKSFSFQMVLYVGDIPRPYPATIHVFRDVQGKDPSIQPDIWLRITVGTDHMGPVDLVFRLHEQKLLSIKATFSSSDSAEQFRAIADDLRTDMQGSSLTLKEILINDMSEGIGRKDG